MSEVKLFINSKFDDKGFRQLDANLQKARTSAIGLGKATATAVGAGMGPAGEFVSQVNAIAGSMDATGVAAVGMAAAIGTAVAGSIYAFKELKESIDAAKDAKQDIFRSEQGGRTTAANIAASVMKEGIQPGTQEDALKNLESAAESARFTGQTEEERKAINDARNFIQSGQAENLGRERTFERNLSPSAKSALDEQALTERLGSQTPAELQAIVDRAERDRERGRKIGGAQGAQLVNESQQIIDETMPYLEAVSKAFAEDLAASVKEEAEKLRADTERANDALSTFFDGSFTSKQSAPDESVSTVMTDARRRIGGSANAPILSTWSTISELQKQTANNTAAIAKNTARSPSAASPLSPAQPR